VDRVTITASSTRDDPTEATAIRSAVRRAADGDHPLVSSIGASSAFTASSSANIPNALSRPAARSCAALRE